MKQVDQWALATNLGPMKDGLEGIRIITICEFAIQRDHRCPSVVVYVAAKSVLWIRRGRDREALRGTFLALGPSRFHNAQTASEVSEIPSAMATQCGFLGMELTAEDLRVDRMGERVLPAR